MVDQKFNSSVDAHCDLFREQKADTKTNLHVLSFIEELSFKPKGPQWN